MQLLTKFWKMKLLTVVASAVALFATWGALAWPDWTAAEVPAQASSEDVAAALQYLAATSAPKAPPAEAALPVEPPVEVHRVVVVTRRQIGAPPAAPGDEPMVVAQQPQSPAPPTPPPPPPAPRQAVPPPAPPAPAPPPPAASAPPAPAPAPKLAPAPAPSKSTGS